MKGSDERIYYLIDRFFNNSCSMEERLELAGWIAQSRNDAALKEYLAEIWQRFEPREDMPAEKANHLFTTILDTEKGKVFHFMNLHSRRMLFYALAVASILIVITGSYFFYSHSLPEARPAMAVASPHIPATDNNKNNNNNRNKVVPVQYKAVLTLSDGSKIALDTAKGADIASEGNSKVENINGQLFYNASLHEKDKTVYHTLTTNKGGQYALTLSDGTILRLNAASSVRFPVTFTGNERNVEITGEVYFEVAHDKRKPFRVKARNGIIEVLGTHFNVNAYPDEPVIRTTLLEGSVKVRSGKSSALLKPNEQAVVKNDDSQIDVYPADAESVMAWKSGYFKLSNSTVPNIMRQIARWYDIDVKYEGAVPSGTISGEIPRSLSLLEVLKTLELSGVHSKLEGKTLVILE